MKRLALLVAVALFGLLAAPAHAATSLSDAVNALKTSPVFVAPDANPTMSPTDAQRVKSQILAGREPIFVAVLPTATAQAEGGVDNLPHALALGVAKQGVFAVVAGNSIRAGASAGLGFNAGEIQQIANRAIASSNPRANGIGALLSSFVAQVDAHRPTTSPAPKSSPAKGTSGWKVFLIVLASLVLVGLVIFGIWGLTKRSARKRQEADELEAFDNELNTLNSRLSAVSEDVVNLGSKMLTDDTRKEAYDKMVLAYSQAKSVLEKAKSTSDLDAAADYLETAETQRAAAQGIKVTDQDGKKIVQATTPKKARTPRKPRNVVVTEAKYQPSPERTTVNQYYYPTGGYYNGMYFGPGYYADPFWTWVEMDMMADAMADRYDSGSSSSDSGDYDSGSSSGTGDWDSGSSSSDSGGGDWGGSSDSGGGDYGGGGGDYGGGGDFGGGGGDFGGGGGGDF